MFAHTTQSCGCEVEVEIRIYEGYGCAGDCCTSTEADIEYATINYCGTHADKE